MVQRRRTESTRSPQITDLPRATGQLTSRNWSSYPAQLAFAQPNTIVILAKALPSRGAFLFSPSSPSLSLSLSLSLPLPSPFPFSSPCGEVGWGFPFFLSLPLPSPFPFSSPCGEVGWGLSFPLPLSLSLSPPLVGRSGGVCLFPFPFPFLLPLWGGRVGFVFSPSPPPLLLPLQGAGGLLFYSQKGVIRG